MAKPCKDCAKGKCAKHTKQKGYQMTTKRCPGCLGAKTRLELGMMQQTCSQCQGIGYIKVAENEQANEANEAKEDVQQATDEVSQPSDKPARTRTNTSKRKGKRSIAKG